jgi:Ubiquitin-2 like Rad60 SUMO-like
MDERLYRVRNDTILMKIFENFASSNGYKPEDCLFYFKDEQLKNEAYVHQIGIVHGDRITVTHNNIGG